MIGALMLVAALQGPLPAVRADTLPVVTLAEALSQAVRLDPAYVQALGELDDAEWARKAAVLVFLLPNVTVSTDYQELSSTQFNIGTGRPTTAAGRFLIDARYEIFTGGRKLANSRAAAAELEAARAGELGQRYATALLVEREYYDVLVAHELLDVATARLRRAEEQFGTARARVTSGATVQSDSLQVLLEVQRARADVLRRGAALTVARLQLGRRIGSAAPVDAAPVDSAPPQPLTLSLDDAVQFAAAQGPAWREARANERSADNQLRARRASYLPVVSLVGSYSTSDDAFFPNATTRRAYGFAVSLPLWDGGQRELAIERLASARNVARAVRHDLELGARRDVTAGYTGYDVARQTLAISVGAVGVAAEVFRVQQARYRAGAASVLELLDAQAELVQAQAELVQARYNARLARAGLEAVLGRRLSNDPERSEP